MARDDGGVWSHTTEPLPPDLYSYFFVVDGLPRSDELNPLGKPVMTGVVESIVHVPGSTTLPWEVGDVPRGEVHPHLGGLAAQPGRVRVASLPVPRLV